MTGNPQTHRPAMSSHTEEPGKVESSATFLLAPAPNDDTEQQVRLAPIADMTYRPSPTP
jgi:hypothetical protein